MLTLTAKRLSVAKSTRQLRPVSNPTTVLSVSAFLRSAVPGFLAAVAVLLVSCSGAPPRPPKVREPLLSWNFISEKRMAAALHTAAERWDALQSAPPQGAGREKLETAYEAAVAAVLSDWGRRQMPKNWEPGATFEGARGTYAVDLLPAPGTPQEVSPLMFDRLRLASDVKVDRKLPQAVEEGLGVPLVGEVLRSEELAAKHPMMPLNGGHLTLTAVLEFGKPSGPPGKGTQRRATLRLYNPLRQPDAPVAGRKTKLAADYTAPKQMALNDGFLKRFSFLGLLYPEKVLADSQLYRLELHDPDRIPVVFVHGLMSDPHIWFNCINAIYADPVLRQHYQPWYFLYPTGLPVPSTSRRLRESLKDARDRLDPDHNDPGMNKMVYVGHSMGGLLSRMQVVDSGDDFWKAHFQVPPEQLNLSTANRERLVENFYFKHSPEIRRLIFIAVPQRGSELADRGIVQRLTSLIRLPLDSLILTKELLSGNTDSLSPQIRDWGMFAFLSVGTLSPKHPYLHALNSKPIPVPHHSIIGKVGSKPLEQSSDRVVPYSSSHLATGSELVVPYWHGCVEKSEVIAEVLKRLHQHLRENGIRR